MFLFLKTLILISKIFVSPAFTDFFFPGRKKKNSMIGNKNCCKEVGTRRDFCKDTRDDKKNC